MIDGSVLHYFNGVEKIIATGDAFIMSPNSIHGFKLCDPKGMKLVDIVIELDYFKNVCNFFSTELTSRFLSSDGFACKLSAEQIAKMNSYMPRLFAIPSEEVYLQTAKLVTSEIVELIASHYAERQSTIPEWVLVLLAELGDPDNFRTILSEITQQFNYNENYMRRIFKQYTKMTMTDYFNLQKLNYAYSLLTSTDLSIENICDTIGLYNTSYFYRIFKKTYHKTPNNARRSIKALGSM